MKFSIENKGTFFYERHHGSKKYFKFLSMLAERNSLTAIHIEVLEALAQEIEKEDYVSKKNQVACHVFCKISGPVSRLIYS